jgi:hypothetical protein
VSLLPLLFLPLVPLPLVPDLPPVSFVLAPVPVPFNVPVSLPVPVPVPVPFVLMLVLSPVVALESDELLLLPELLQLNDANAMIAINNALLMVIVFYD